MKNWCYIAIFLMVVLLVGWGILYNASTIDDGTTEMKLSEKSTTQKSGDEVMIPQKEIDVLNGVDIEADMMDVAEDDMSGFDDLDLLSDQGEISF